MKRRQWVAMLAKLVAPMDAATAAQALADMLPLLADVPEGAFEPASLTSAAAAAPHRVPTFTELHRALLAWWDENKPPLPALPAPYDEALTDEDRHHLAVFMRQSGEAGASERWLEMRLDWMRSGQLSRVFDHLCRTHKTANKVAIARGWIDET